VTLETMHTRAAEDRFNTARVVEMSTAIAAGAEGHLVCARCKLT